MSLRVALIDYGMGNLRSVEKALISLGAEVTITNQPADLAQAQAVVLPGVGAFGAAMKNLNQLQWVKPIQAWIKAGKPFLGICLGYQVLFEESEEDRAVVGLQVFKGPVVRFRKPAKVPHIGWNSLILAKDHPLWEGIPQSAFFYFVHSFYPIPEDAGLVVAWCEYEGERFAAAISCNKTFACQFHPEKSQKYGLKLLANFLLWASS